VRPGRKIGHVNLVGASAGDVDSLRQRATVVANIIRDGRLPAAASGTTEETP
jgi:5-(carboxyamino)imidazole ribonucleotide synthase